MRAADLATWKQHIFDPIKHCKAAYQLADQNLRAVHELEKLQAEWERGLADTRQECCVCLKCPPMLGCLLPTFAELAGHPGLKAALDEASLTQPQRTSSDEHGLPSFELKSALGNAYLDVGGAQYLAKLFRINCKALQRDDAFRIEYTCSIKPGTAADMLAAACQVEAEVGFEIRFVALIRGFDRHACEVELGQVAEALQQSRLLQQYVVGFDITRNVFELDHMPFRPRVCRDLARRYALDIRIDLGPAMSRRQLWRTLCEGLDTASTALSDGHQVRLGHGVLQGAGGEATARRH